MIPDLVEVGFVRKPKGFNGLIKVATEERFEDSLLKASFVFLNMDGSMVPFAVEQVELAKDIVIKLEDVRSSDDVKPLLGKEMYLEANLVDSSTQNNPRNEELRYGMTVGYSLVDKTGQKIGVIENVEQYPGQEMATLQLPGGREALIPLVEAFVLEVNDETRSVLVDLPEGLIST